MTVPLLILTDSPDLPSGLARIGRDLAMHIHSHMQDQVRVGYLGRGGIGGDFPFPVWTIPHSEIGRPGSGEWGGGVLPLVWERFTNGASQPGVLLTIFDPARMLWLARPEYLSDGPTKDFLTNRPFKLWGYFPVDGHTQQGGLGKIAAETLAGYDRVLGYGEYGSGILTQVLGRNIEHLPHGIGDVWQPKDRVAARALLNFPDDAFVVGVVAANQQRKDWGLAAQVCGRLMKRFGDRLRIWWHVDHLQNPRAWDLDAVIGEFGIGPALTVSRPPVTDEWLAQAYSACDVTLGIGAGEGFGYPIVESQACGVPVVHWNYGGGAEYASIRMTPAAMRVEGPINVQRPVGSAAGWGDGGAVGQGCRDGGCVRAAVGCVMAQMAEVDRSGIGGNLMEDMPVDQDDGYIEISKAEYRRLLEKSRDSARGCDTVGMFIM